MREHEKPLYLTENYNFDVLVKDGNNNFAGKLILSPNECTLRMMGERQLSESFPLSQAIECHAFRRFFLLSEINFKSQWMKNLRSTSGSAGHFFEIEFSVGFIISSSHPITNEEQYNGFYIDSDMIKQWIGITKKQSNLLEQYHNSTLNPGGEDLNQFIQTVDGLGSVFLTYDLAVHMDLESISSGVKFTPRLGVNFDNSKNFIEIFNEIKKLYVLLTYFWGSDFVLNHVRLFSSSAQGREISVYYITNLKEGLINNPLIPLGLDLCDNQLDYSELPLELFNNYYNLSEDKIGFFMKYLRYKRLKSEEEKFLGYFRILEKIVHEVGSYVDPQLLEALLNRSEDYLKAKLVCRKKDIKSLTTRVLQANNGKFNTATCIIRFYETISEELKSIMNYDKSDIERICKLRNDITHANEYYVTDEDLYKYTKFIQQLLCFALFNQVLEAPLDLLIPLTANFERIR